MTWNYRIIRYKNGALGLHEVYYDDAGKVSGYTEESIVECGPDESVVGLQNSLQMMLKDIERHEILNEADLPDGS